MSELLQSLKRINWTTVLLLWSSALVVFFAVAIPSWQAEATLGTAAYISGYSLFACIIFLGLFKVRKHLSMLPLLPARFWFSMHSMVGVLALLLYVLHVDHWWPDSGYVRLLAALMLAVTITGFIGYLIEKIYPRRLTHKGDDILFETIPDACYQIRMEVENLLFTQIRETGSDTLSRHYMESMDWYFQRPRFIWSHLSGGRKADYWLKQQFATVNRYLNQAELEYSQQLEILANKKQGLDYQYTVQGIIKLWLLVHVPLSVMLLVMSLWHLLLVNIYSA